MNQTRDLEATSRLPCVLLTWEEGVMMGEVIILKVQDDSNLILSSKCNRVCALESRVEGFLEKTHVFFPLVEGCLKGGITSLKPQCKEP